MEVTMDAPLQRGPALTSPDDVPVAPGAMCGACGTGRYLGSTGRPGRVVCTRCGNGRPALV
jgi:hypothetical protein